MWLWEHDDLKLFVAIMAEPDRLVLYELTQRHLHLDHDLLKALITLARVMEWGLYGLLTLVQGVALLQQRR